MTSARSIFQSVSFGSFLAAGSNVVASAMASSGYDWLLVDLEHGAGGETALSGQLAAVHSCAVPCFVRVESSERIRIGRALDLGADGIMVPRVESASDAATIVRRSAFTPVGDRGVAVSTHAASFGAVSVANLSKVESPVVIIQIESGPAVAASESIAQTPGVDCLFVGPADLSSSLGIAGDLGHPRMLEALERVLGNASKHGKAAGVMARSAEDAERYRKLGFRFIALSSDILMLAASARGAVAEARQTAQGQ